VTPRPGNNEGGSAPLTAAKLGALLDKSEKVKETVLDARDDLAAVNADIHAEKPEGLPARTVDLSMRAEVKVVKAAHELEEVNVQLEEEVAARVGMESALQGAESALASSQMELAAVRAKEREARYRSLHDAGTGLPNRDLFHERLEHGLVQAERHSWNLAVVFIDLDDFKAVNDTHGHVVGDALLRSVARRLEAGVRAEDTVSRFGGDEFMCILLGVKSKADAEDVVQKLMERVGAKFETHGAVLVPSASVGIAMYPDDGTTADVLLQFADKAMYRRKSGSPARHSRGGTALPD
jgi:diguanylate cyclase (GGDEF)-like protein